jgi:hypothetical protein
MVKKRQKSLHARNNGRIFVSNRRAAHDIGSAEY